MEKGKGEKNDEKNDKYIFHILDPGTNSRSILQRVYKMERIYRKNDAWGNAYPFAWVRGNLLSYISPFYKKLSPAFRKYKIKKILYFV